ncbi:hypothetical protein SLEP1_g16681 [Rubroshorea leprosula]|uniref:Uncharacterized protein n=1 Tax=Rubroshorea leprosula TaxID=152421 RepID=A0AAV5J253_9ROSI|nr:hypothetical protein SLEP1_g16681 [Rubroshorea leprosula]
MSSEKARSVVGSEVMPLEYGSMDTESSPSPTNGCYDPDLEIVSEVRGYVSELGSRSSLRGLVGNCNLPHHVLIRPAGVNERACSAPRDHWMPIYLHYLIAGLRFPIPELLVELLLDYSIGITQLTPNAMRAVIGGRRDGTTSALGRPVKGIGLYSLLDRHPSKGGKKNSSLWTTPSGVGGMPKWNSCLLGKLRKPSRTTIMGGEEEEEEEQGTGVGDQAARAEVQPPEVHPVSSDEVQQLAPPEVEVPPQPAEDEPRSPPPLAEEQPPLPAE